MQVNFGGFTEIAGKQVMTGIASHLNSNEIIEAQLKGDEVAIKNVEKNIKSNNTKIKAYNKLELIIKKFQDALQPFNNNFLASGAKDDIFQKKQVTLLSNNNVNANSYVQVKALSATQNGSFNISNFTIATNETQYVQGFTDPTISIVSATPTIGNFTAGTLQINGIDITLNAGDSLNDIINTINNLSPNIGVKASKLKLTPNNYQLTITSNETGIDNAFIYDDPDDIFFGNTNFTWNTVSATDASFDFNNSRIARPTNIISDLVGGLEITLQQSTPAGANINVSVNSNNDGIIAKIKKFVEAYNDITIFYEQMNQRDPETNQYLDSSPLGEDSVFDSIMNEFRFIVMSKINLLPTEDESQFDIGIKLPSGEYENMVVENINYDPLEPTSDKNPKYSTIQIKDLLQLDEHVLKMALNSDADQVRKLFVLDYDSSNSNFGLVNPTKNPNITKLNIALTDTSTMINLTTKNFSNTNLSVVSATPTPGHYTQGTLKINNINVNLTAGDSLQDIVDNINTLVPNISATIKQDGNSSNYRLALLPSNGATSFTIIDNNNILLANMNASVAYTLTPTATTISYEINGRTFNANASSTSTAAGFTITASPNTDIAGLLLNYYSRNPGTTTMNTSQGIAYRLGYSVKQIMGIANNGIIKSAISSITAQNFEDNHEIAKLTDFMDKRRIELLERFAQLEASIAKTNSVLKFLDNNDVARRIASGN